VAQPDICGSSPEPIAQHRWTQRVKKKVAVRRGSEQKVGLLKIFHRDCGLGVGDSVSEEKIEKTRLSKDNSVNLKTFPSERPLLT